MTFGFGETTEKLEDGNYHYYNLGNKEIVLYFDDSVTEARKNYFEDLPSLPYNQPTGNIQTKWLSSDSCILNFNSVNSEDVLVANWDFKIETLSRSHAPAWER